MIKFDHECCVGMKLQMSDHTFKWNSFFKKNLLIVLFRQKYSANMTVTSAPSEAPENSNEGKVEG